MAVKKDEKVEEKDVVRGAQTPDVKDDSKPVEIVQGATYKFVGPYAPYDKGFEAKVIGYSPVGQVHVAIQDLEAQTHERLTFHLGGGWELGDKVSGDHEDNSGSVDVKAFAGPSYH